MGKPTWAKNLDAETFDFVSRTIKSVPGFFSYVKSYPKSDDIFQLTKEYIEALAQGHLLNSSIIANLDLVCGVVQRESFIYPDSIRSWNPQPLWARTLGNDDIIFIDHFLSRTPFLLQYVKANTEESSLSRIISDYQVKFNIPFEEKSAEGIIMFAIKERFNGIQSKKSSDAFFAVDNAKIINDRADIDSYIQKAEEGFYKSNPDNDDYSDFLSQYLEHFNPYIGFEIIDRLLHLEKVDNALPFLKLESTYIFSTANIYWNNKESLYGCAIVSYDIIELLSPQMIKSIENDNPELCKILFRSSFLLLSRVINWEDLENRQKPSYNDKLLPINVQHKIRAHSLRGALIEKYSSKLIVELDDNDYALMLIADHMSAHFWAYASKVVGDNSVFKQKAYSLFSRLQNRSYQKIEDAMKDGLAIIDSLSRRFYIEYIEGKYFLNYHSIKELFKADCIKSDTKHSFSSTSYRDIMENHEEDNYSIPYKKDYQEIKNYLEEKGIKCFYHFTEISRIESIIKYGGILSYQRCLENNIVIPVTKDMA